MTGFYFGLGVMPFHQITSWIVVLGGRLLCIACIGYAPKSEKMD
jgi:hypothetical protein